MVREKAFRELTNNVENVIVNIVCNLVVSLYSEYLIYNMDLQYDLPNRILHLLNTLRYSGY